MLQIITQSFVISLLLGFTMVNTRPPPSFHSLLETNHFIFDSFSMCRYHFAFYRPYSFTKPIIYPSRILFHEVEYYDIHSPLFPLPNSKNESLNFFHDSSMFPLASGGCDAFFVFLKPATTFPQQKAIRPGRFVYLTILYEAPNAEFSESRNFNLARSVFLITSTHFLMRLISHKDILEQSILHCNKSVELFQDRADYLVALKLFISCQFCDINYPKAYINTLLWTLAFTNCNLDVSFTQKHYYNSHPSLSFLEFREVAFRVSII